MAEMSKPVRWLHLSDFHTGHDKSGQRQMFKDLLVHIKQHVEEEEASPDLVFITGDIANSGKAEEYQLFFDDFLFDLADFLFLSSDLPPNIFLIPGNHDVQRNELDRLGLRQFFSEFPRTLDPDGEGKKQRQRLIERFQDYIEAKDLHDCTPVKGEWLRGEAASYLYKDFLRHDKEKQIGIVGLNTAWFSGAGEDQHNLSPGKLVVAKNLDQLDDCVVKIILGHHQVDWFLAKELEPIRSRFARSGVIYLHGDQHKNRVRLEEASGRQFLTIESGAAFQGRDDEVWTNRLMWCNLYLDEQRIHMHPRIWSVDNQEWSLDSSLPESKRIKGTDYWEYMLPNASRAASPSPSVSRPTYKGWDMSKPPFEGWKFITQGFIEKRINALSEDEALSYFDGGDVTWQVALSESVPRREVVQVVYDAMTAPRRAVPDVTVLWGGGGEGKSTAMFQVAADLLKNHPAWTMLWQEKAGTHLPAEFWSQRPLNEGEWLIVIDEADLILKEIHELTKTLPVGRRSQFHILLCCRDTDWRSERADTLPWNRDGLVKVPKEPLSGITETDAGRVIQAWKECKQDGSGLGKLQGLSEPEAVQRLVAMAKEEAVKKEGAFLGAMLQTRFGDNLQNHVLNLLNSLNQKRLASPHEEKTLLEAFAYIAALHAEEITILTEEILAECLGVNWEREIGYLYRHVISLLGREVGTNIRRGGDPGDRHPTILTRHRLIAETAVKVLTEAFNIDWASMFKSLVRKAISLREEHRAYVPELGVWRQLPAHFSKQKGAGHFFHTEQERVDFAIDLADMLVERDQADPLYVTQLAELYTSDEQHHLAIETFRRGARDISYFKRDKLYYHDWAKSEGLADNFALSAWLDGIALSKSSLYPTRKDNYTRDGYTMMFLHGLSINFKKLSELHPASKSVFRSAWAAAVQKALTLTGNYMTADTRRKLEQNQTEIENEGLSKPAYPFETVIEGMIAAWKVRETTALDGLLLAADVLVFDL